MGPALLLAVLLCGVATPPHPQSQTQPATNPSAPPPDNPQAKPSDPKSSPSKPLTPAEQRQAQLEADTARLYQLTQELKAEVAKSNKDTLSVSVIKKAEEIEKLAKSLKERARNRQ